MSAFYFFRAQADVSTEKDEEYELGGLVRVKDPAELKQRLYRFAQMVGPGDLRFSEQAVELLALSDADVESTRRMVERGCPLHLILRIQL